MLLAHLVIRLHIKDFLCKNETYRKVAPRLFYMSHGQFSKWRRLFPKRRRLFEKSRWLFFVRCRLFERCLLYPWHGSTSSIFGSTSQRIICTRKCHIIRWLRTLVALVAPAFCPNLLRVRVNRSGWPRGGIVMRGDHLGEYGENIFCHPFKPLALLLRQRTRKQDNKQLIITTVRVTADSG